MSRRCRLFSIGISLVSMLILGLVVGCTIDDSKSHCPKPGITMKVGYIPECWDDPRGSVSPYMGKPAGIEVIGPTSEIESPTGVGYRLFKMTDYDSEGRPITGVVSIRSAGVQSSLLGLASGETYWLGRCMPYELDYTDDYVEGGAKAYSTIWFAC